jgi:type II secretory pathway pseudopilin PulG
MKTRPVRILVTVVIALIGFLMTSAVYSASTPPAQTTAQELQKKVADAVQAIKSYSAAQRDQTVEKAKAVLDDFDARIKDLESRLGQKWDQMDQAARQEAMSAMTSLRKQRNAAAEWYGGLKHGSSQAWEDVKTGFSKSAYDLEDAFRKAYGHI